MRRRRKFHTIMSIEVGHTLEGVNKEGDMKIQLSAHIDHCNTWTLRTKYYNEYGDNPLNSSQTFVSMVNMLHYIESEYGAAAAKDIAEDMLGCLSDNRDIANIKRSLEQSHRLVDILDEYFDNHRRAE